MTTFFVILALLVPPLLTLATLALAFRRGAGRPQAFVRQVGFQYRPGA